MTGPGETADFEVTFARPGGATLRLTAPFATRPWTMDVPVRVRGRPE